MSSISDADRYADALQAVHGDDGDWWEVAVAAEARRSQMKRILRRWQLFASIAVIVLGSLCIGACVALLSIT